MTRSLTGLAIAVALVAIPLALHATTFLPKTDNAIAAIDVRTGKVEWTHEPATLSDAHFEIHAELIVAYPHYAGSDKSNPIVLTRSGKLATGRKPPRTAPLAKSAVHWPPPAVALRNGWELTGYSPGNTKSLQFRDRKTRRVAWTVRTGGYPHQVRAWKNTVFFAISYLSDDGVTHAYRAGRSKPAWTFDVNDVVKGRARPLTRLSLEVIGDVLYVGAHEHVFALRPDTGKLLWHRDLATDLGLKFKPDMFGGALALGVLTRSGDVLIASFERRVVALDTKRGKYLWHLEPDTFPHTPYPAAHGGKLYLTVGAKHRLHVLPR